MPTDRRTLTEEEKAECAALKAAIAEASARRKDGKRHTQESLAQELGMTQGNLSSHLNGKRAVSKDLAARVTLVLGVPVEAFSPRLAGEIAQMAKAIQGPSFKVGKSKVEQGKALFDRVSPRSQAVIEKIAALEAQGKLTDDDMSILEKIIERFGATN